MRRAMMHHQCQISYTAEKSGETRSVLKTGHRVVNLGDDTVAPFVMLSKVLKYHIVAIPC